MKPAIRIVFAPLFLREKKLRERGHFLHGTANYRTIKLDPRGSTILETLIHEMTHIDKPSWSETKVKAHTRRQMAKLTWKQKANLLKLLGSAKIEGEE